MTTSVAATVRLPDADIALLAHIATGAPTEVIARRLDVSERTVRRRLRAICERLCVHTTVEAVVWAVRRGLV
jgi:DNA-binding NarL/FixJ family response regulator